MPDLYPLRLVPDFRERVWGTRDLAPIYTSPPGQQPVGEVWLTGDDCRVSNGPLAGQTLGELCRRFGRDLVGTSARRSDCFPLLIKFLFPEQKLSVQVHPDDAAARRAGLPCGKSECWYVLAAKPGAKIGLGLKPGVTRAGFEQAIQDGKADDLLHWVEVHRGEMIYSPAGTVHAIGPGMLLVETQQNSDTTYRLYDYGRGRELHVAEGLAAMRETRAGKVERMGDDDMARLLASPHFIVHKQSAREAWFRESAPEWNSVEILVGLDGGGLVECPGAQTTVFSRGEAVVIPAALKQFTLKPQGEIEFLAVTLPERGRAPEPKTYL
ncbi:MAG TPA: type I phosphomannose isomerase catalytic subunit [Terriglobales bacterium]|nr:type I phosphomannose isomerase catalytic subunit [Terriglobales bacterium]